MPTNRDLSAEERQWLDRAIEQLDGFENQARERLVALAAPPAGNQAARRRELKRRARVEHLRAFLEHGLHQAVLARAALEANPQAGKAVYHALMTGMLAQYPDTADVRETSLAKREAAIETNARRKFNKSAGR